MAVNYVVKSFSIFIPALCYLWMAPVFALEAYQPKLIDQMQETWRWQEVKKLDTHGLLSLTATEDSIWLGLAGGGVIQYDSYQWKKFGREEGLLDLRVAALLASRDGTVYARTHNRLFRYENDRWHTVFKTELDRRNAKLVETADGSIWSLEEVGLIQVKDSVVTNHALGGLDFDDMHADTDQNLWLVANLSGDLHVYPTVNGVLQQHKGKIIPSPIEGANVFNEYRITRLNDCVWIASKGVGIILHCYDVKSDQWRKTNLKKLGGTHRHYGIHSSKDGSLWVWGEYSISRLSNGQWKTYYSPHLVTQRAYNLIEAHDGSIWLGGMEMNLKRINMNRDQWGVGYEDLHFQCEAPVGTRWFLESKGKVVSHNIVTDSWRAFTPQDTGIERPVKIMATSDGTIWLAGREKGSAAVARLYGNSWQRDIHKSLSRNLSHAAALEISDGRVLFGSLDFATDNRFTSQQHGGLVEYKKHNGQYTYRQIKPPFAPMHIYAMVELPDRRLLLASGTSVYSLADSQRLGIDHIQTMPDIPGKFPIKQVSSHYIITDPQNHVWISRSREGVFQSDGTKWKRYTVADGLPSNIVSHLSALPDGSVLAITHKGISRFDGQVWSPFLDYVDPAHSKVDNIKLASDGGIWMNHAIPSWHSYSLDNIPQNIMGYRTRYYRSERNPPDTHIASFNQRVEQDGYNHVYWAGVDAWASLGSNSLQYSYRLNNEPWSPFATKQRQLFDKLPSGNYSFEVRARDQDLNIDPTPARIQFQVIPPIWQQHWFQITAIVMLGMCVFFVFAMFRLRVKHLREIDEMKLGFFTNVSHELRTPLTLILGPVEKMMEKAGTDKENLSLIRRNAHRLMDLVNQLLDFRKLQTGMMPINKTQSDIVSFVKAVADSLDPLAEQKQIDYIVNAPNKSFGASFDCDMLEKILSNLISNAIKYTAEEGRVKVELKLVSSSKNTIDTAKLTVEDNGLGIDKSQIEKVFDPFYRANASELSVDGSGIGLTLVKELVELCNGHIELQSPIYQNGSESAGYGTRFIVSLPLEDISLSEQSNDAAIASTATAKQTDDSLRDYSLFVGNVDTNQESSLANRTSSKSDRPCILIVEDDMDLRRFIKNELSKDYFIMLESNGLDGLEAARQFTPDLIVTDIMMPMIDGNEFCRRLNLDSATRDIPIIVLTARSSATSELEALELGADDYITKPFSVAVLKARIDKILSINSKFHERYDEGVIIRTGNSVLKEADSEFLRRAVDTIESSISISNYDVTQFAEDMGMKHKTLYIRIKSLTNLSLKMFIRTVRLKHGLKLLRDSKSSVAEVSEKVGFHDPNYFSRCFKKQFGISPTDVERPE